MDKKDFFAELRRALSGLPSEERDNVLKYYEDYFLDAEGESDAEIIRGLGDPQKIAADILKEYRDLQPHSWQKNTAPPPRRWKGISPWLLLVLVVFAIPIGIPLVIGLGATLLGILISIIAFIVAIVIVAFAVPAALAITGIALLGLSFCIWGDPASALMMVGGGFVCLALGGLAGLLLVKLCLLFVPPLFRWFVALLRWPIDKLRVAFRRG